MGPGTIIDGRFELVQPLGAGGMGTVYEAIDQSTSQRVALKVISQGRLGKSSVAVRRLLREGRAVGALRSPHIVRLVNAGIDTDSDLPYLAMELLQGEDLRQVFRRAAPLPPTLALHLAAQACQGLVEAHGAGLLHRDIKPANLFVCTEPDGSCTLKILDFGLAKLLRRSDGESGLQAMETSTSLTGSELTTEGHVLGSPAYMSPEQALGLQDHDARSDLWSLGVVLYEALSGTLPFGDRPTLGQVILAICSEVPTPIRDVAPWLDPDVGRLVHRALTKARDARFASAKEMLAAIEAIVGTNHRVPFAAIQRLPVVAPSSRRARAESVTEPASEAAGVTASNSMEGPGKSGRPAGTMSWAVDLVGSESKGLLLTKLLHASGGLATYLARDARGNQCTVRVHRGSSDDDWRLSMDTPSEGDAVISWRRRFGSAPRRLTTVAALSFVSVAVIGAAVYGASHVHSAPLPTERAATFPSAAASGDDRAASVAPPSPGAPLEGAATRPAETAISPASSSSSSIGQRAVRVPKRAGRLIAPAPSSIPAENDVYAP